MGGSVNTKFIKSSGKLKAEVHIFPFVFNFFSFVINQRLSQFSYIKELLISI